MGGGRGEEQSRWGINCGEKIQTRLSYTVDSFKKTMVMVRRKPFYVLQTTVYNT